MRIPSADSRLMPATPPFEIVVAGANATVVLRGLLGEQPGEDRVFDALDRRIGTWPRIAEVRVDLGGVPYLGELVTRVILGIRGRTDRMVLLTRNPTMREACELRFEADHGVEVARSS